METRTVIVEQAIRSVVVEEAVRTVVLDDPPATVEELGLELVTTTVDLVVRHMAVRDPGGVITDVAVWLAGLGHYGFDLLQRVPPASSGRADIGPNALQTRLAGPGWVTPGLPADDHLYPPQAPSDLTDIHYLVQIVAFARARWGTGIRLWLVGASKGGLLAWAALAYNLTYDLPFSGFWISAAGMPKGSFYGWSPQGRIGSFTPKPVAIRHGSSTSDTVSQDDAGAQDWTTTVSGLLAVCGRVAWGSPSPFATCCGQPISLRIAAGAGGVRARDYDHGEAPHGWQSCPSHPTSPCQEAVYALAWLVLNGMAA